MSKRDPERLTSEAFFAAAQTALRRFRFTEQEWGGGSYQAPRVQRKVTAPTSSPPASKPTVSLPTSAQKIIQKLLALFSIGQIHNLVWRAARDAGARIRREPIAPQHAANSAIGAIERMGERAQVEGWILKPYRRDRRFQESTLSHLLFRVMFGLDEPFEMRIDPDVVRAKIQPLSAGEA